VACGPINEMVQAQSDMWTCNGTRAGCVYVSEVCIASMGAQHMSNIYIHTHDEAILHLGADYIEAAPGHVV
jgi:hypothetical protein